MLKTIKKIQNVGTFRACEPDNIELGKITLIYGNNTFGKSTLGDIFCSLQNNDPALITKRASIPACDKPATIDMKFAPAGQKEKKVYFDQDKWLKHDQQLQVFNDAFYHKHVFVGSGFTQDTKANFSRFILGVKGVEVAEQIQEQEALKQQKLSRLSVLQQDAFSDIDDIDGFVKSTPEGNLLELFNRQQALAGQHKDLQTQQSRADEITKRPYLAFLEIDVDILSCTEKANELFEKAPKSYHDEAKLKLARHIKKHPVMGKDHTSEYWLHQGLKYHNSQSCQFCGQTFDDAALALIDVYRQCFDEAFDRHATFVEQELQRGLLPANSDVTAKLASMSTEHELFISQYPELVTDEHFSELKNSLQALKTSLTVDVDTLESESEVVRADYQQKVPLKRANPHKSVEAINVDRLQQIVGKLSVALHEYNGVIAKINDQISQFKAGLEKPILDQRIATLSTELAKVERTIKRFEKQTQCDEYSELTRSIAQADAAIAKLETSLIQEQNKYLERYFSDINRLFNALGSKDFKLSRAVDEQGEHPVYYLKVKFKQVEISEQDLDKAFSESDRRALGLAIFLSSLEGLDKEQLAKTIVVFDDPVTSFDDHRVGVTYREIVNLSERCAQVILLSHYREGIRQFVNVQGHNNNDVKLLEIDKDNETSKLIATSSACFAQSLKDEGRDSILDFIERKNKHPSIMLRVYLESELIHRFGKQIREHDIKVDKLGKLIDVLKKNDIISTDVAKKLHRWREDLNPDHHICLGNTIEDKRNTAHQFMMFVFHELVAQP